MSRSTPTPAAAGWRLRPGQQLRYREWDDEFVVFNDLSGACHLLDGAGFALVRHLQQRQGPVALATLVEEMAAQFDDIDPADTAPFNIMLASLAACELVETWP